MRRLLLLFSCLLAAPCLAGTVRYWSFEDDSLPPGGRLSVCKTGVAPVFAEVARGKEIWDGGTYSRIQEDNRRSAYFAPVSAPGLAPAGGEIVFPGGEADLRLPSLTVECVVRVEGQDRRFALLASKRRGGDGATWSLAIGPDGVVTARFDTQQGDSKVGFNRTASSGVQVSDGEWHHVALAYDHATRTGTLFVDYERCRSATTTGPLVYDEAELTIGRGLSGWIDSVRISDSVLHPEQFLRPTRFFSDARAQSRKRLDVMLDLTPTRVQTEISLDWEPVGTLAPKSVEDIPGDFWSLGCETLDRDLADWDAYKGYLKPLGIRRIRLQGGWAKTEKRKGVYDFGWLDHIVDSAHELGLTVCLETSYGNRLYEPGAGLGPGGLLPDGEETLAAWDAWVEAMVRHYRPKGVREWMMYNEPNLRRENTIDRIVVFNARTAGIIKRIDPDAKIAGLVAAGLRTSLVEDWLKGLKEAGKLDLFEWVVYHGYGVNPDSLAAGMAKAKELVRQYSPTIKLWQGEAGCASEEVQYALSGIAWTEISHAKWNARRMLCDFGHGIESTVFTISDISYHKDFISRYGLLKTAPDNSVVKVKAAYYAVNNVVSLFNGSLQAEGAARVSVLPAEGMAVYAFRDRRTGSDLIALWNSRSLPVHACELTNVELRIEGMNLPEPVWVDLLTGRIHRVPTGNIRQDGQAAVLRDFPVFDSPVVLADRAALSYVKARESKRKPAKKPAQSLEAFPLKSYRLDGTQKPAPAVVLCCADGVEAEWAERLAARLQAHEIHAFVLAPDAGRSPASAVARVRAQASAWQVDPKQIGIAGTARTVADYAQAGADFAIAFGPDAAGDGEDLHRVDARALREGPAADAPWLLGLLKWLDLRKTPVF